MNPDGYFSISLKDQAFVVEPGRWVVLPFDLGSWVPDGYGLLTLQLYADLWDDWEGPTDIRTRLLRRGPSGVPDPTAESVHTVANDWALDRTTLMYLRRDTPVEATIKVAQAPITLHTLIYRGVPLDQWASTP